MRTVFLFERIDKGLYFGRRNRQDRLKLPLPLRGRSPLNAQELTLVQLFDPRHVKPGRA